MARGVRPSLYLHAEAPDKRYNIILYKEQGRAAHLVPAYRGATKAVAQHCNKHIDPGQLRQRNNGSLPCRTAIR